MSTDKPLMLTVSISANDGTSVSVTKEIYNVPATNGSISVGAVVGAALKAFTDDMDFGIGPAMKGIAQCFPQEDDAELVARAMAIFWAGTDASLIGAEPKDLEDPLADIVKLMNEALEDMDLPFKLAVVDANNF